METWLLTSIFLACRWIHPQCLPNFENIFYPLLHGCQKTFLPKIFESEAVCRHSLICCMSSCKLTDIFWSMTHHVPSIYMNTPLSVCGLKGMISVSTIILDDFTFYLHSFSHCVSSIVNDQFHCLQQNNNVKWNISLQVLTPSFLLA